MKTLNVYYGITKYYKWETEVEDDFAIKGRNKEDVFEKLCDEFTELKVIDDGEVPDGTEDQDPEPDPGIIEATVVLRKGKVIIELT